MLLRNKLSNTLITCKPETPVREVAKLMKQNEVGAVLVVEIRRPVGIITDRDLTLRCMAEVGNLSLMTAEDVMSGAVETVNDEDDVADVIRKMRRASIRRIPVVNAVGEAVGLISFDDMFDVVAEEVAAMRDVVRPRLPKLAGQSA